MSAAAARMTAMPAPTPPDMIDLPVDRIEADHAGANPLLDEIRAGFEEPRAMSHDELRDVISRRVTLLETVLRDRAVRIQKNVNLASAARPPSPARC